MAVRYLTELDKAFAELELADEAAVLRVGCAFQRRERDGEELLRRIENQISLLAAVGSNQRRLIIRSVKHTDGIKWAANERNDNNTCVLKKKTLSRLFDGGK